MYYIHANSGKATKNKQKENVPLEYVFFLSLSIYQVFDKISKVKVQKHVEKKS